jgi:hypothetical protein
MNIDILGLSAFDISRLRKYAHPSLHLSQNDLLHGSDLVPHVLLDQMTPADFEFRGLGSFTNNFNNVPNS